MHSIFVKLLNAIFPSRLLLLSTILTLRRLLPLSISLLSIIAETESLWIDLPSNIRYHLCTGPHMLLLDHSLRPRCGLPSPIVHWLVSYRIGSQRLVSRIKLHLSDYLAGRRNVIFVVQSRGGVISL